MKMRLLWILTLGGFCYGSECGDQEVFKDAGPHVKTSLGSVVGKYVKVFDTNVAAFLGIPYAKPPLGNKRFMKPDPVEKWDGMLLANEKPPPCMQYSSRNYSWIPTSKPSENCLFLNVWAPAKSQCGNTDKLAVLVWIYGGGYYAGSSDMGVYDGSVIASYGNVIVVSMNYRVGVFGFLNVGVEDAHGNMGLHDQLLALRWIQENIENFGGDPRRITLFGESAGSMSISMHILSPLSKNIFQRAIMQSGSPFNPQLVDNIDVALFKANAYVEAVGCNIDSSSVKTPEQILECLKKKDAMDLAVAENVFTSKFPLFFVPTTGNEFMPKSVVEILESGDFNQVDLLVGDNNDEATIFLNYIMPQIFPLDETPKVSLNLAKTIIQKLFETVPNLPNDKVFEFYFGNLTDEDTESIATNISNAYGDYAFVCPSMYFAEKIENAYMYWMTHRSIRNTNADWVGVTHFEEVPFVFGQPILDSFKYTPEDGKFSGSLIQKWTTFARHGHPLENADNQTWSKFSASHPYSFELNARHQGQKKYPRLEACEFWRPHFAFK